MRRVLGVVMVVALAAACGDSADPAPEPAATEPGAEATEPPTAAAEPSAESGSSDAVVPIDVPACDLLTADEVSAATGLDVAEVVDDPPIGCLFDLGSEAGVDIFVVVDDGEGRAMGSAALMAGYRDLVASGEAEQLDGLGVEALYAAGFRGLAADAGGGRFVAVGVSGGFAELSEPRAVLIDLAQAALARLG